MYKRDFSNFNEAAFIQECQFVNWEEVVTTCIPSNLLKLLMYNRLSNFIEKMNIIYAKQFGFRSHHSTEYAILSIVDKTHEEIEKGMFS